MTKDLFDEDLYLQVNPDVAAAVRSGVFRNGREHFDRHGREEGRSWDPSVPRSREDKLLRNIDLSGKGLEIGPSHNPVAPKKAGYNVDILDHLDTAGLKAKYTEHGVNLENIEEVDFVWSGEPMHELIDNQSCYDWIIASHVIEHTPDLVSFLQQCRALLKPDGRLALVIPDKRYCFDHFQSISLTGSILDAYHERRTRPSPGQVFEHLSNASARNNNPAWDASTSGPFSLVHSLDQARDVWNQARIGSHYFDVHCWRFTPASFRLVISDLRALDLVRFSEAASYDTAGCEFYSILKNDGDRDPVAERISALRAIREEELGTD